jgi:hypothetical protein
LAWGDAFGLTGVTAHATDPVPEVEVLEVDVLPEVDRLTDVDPELEPTLDPAPALDPCPGED